MKKIVAGQIYDTATSEKLGEWMNDFPRNDPAWSQEDLYLTQKGTYFLHGQSGAAGAWCNHVNWSKRTAGEDIITMLHEGAKYWAKKRLPAEKYEFFSRQATSRHKIKGGY